MTKSRLLVDYEIVEMSGTKLAIFKNGGEDVYVVNKETAYILNLLKKGFRNVEIVSEIKETLIKSQSEILQEFLYIASS